MSANLDYTTGRAAIAYTGKPPWHGEGIKLNPESTFDEWRIAAGLDYEVDKRAIYFSTLDAEGNRKPQIIESKRALIRTDTQEHISIVGKDYHVVQPRKVFEFFQDLVQQEGLAIEVAGALDGGRKIWALAKMDDSYTLHGRDTQIPYVLVATSYDSSLATQAMLTNTRVVCDNTMRFSGAYGSIADADSVKIRHDREFNIREAHGKLGLDEGAWNEYKTNIANLARFQLSPEDALEYFHIIAGQGDQIVRNEDNGTVISLPEPSRVTKQFINAYLNGPGANYEGSRGTLWGAVNAVTFYQDHLAPASGNGQRFNSSTFGGGNVRKQHAFSLALSKFDEAVAA
jgi:phage/plasmid-like protein (TIGR03299 family)